MARAPKLVNFSHEKMGPEGAWKCIGTRMLLLSVPTSAEELRDPLRPLSICRASRGHEPRAASKVVLIVQDPFTSYYAPWCVTW